MIASFVELLRQPRFCALVIHTGCSTGTFLIVATASSSLMKELLHRPATEFGLYFAMVPMGFVIGTIIFKPGGESRFRQHMILHWGFYRVDRGLCAVEFVVVRVQSPLVLFLPGSFITLAQGLSLPFAQAGAMATIPRLAGTAAGIRCFCSKLLWCRFCAALRNSGGRELFAVSADWTDRVD